MLFGLHSFFTEFSRGERPIYVPTCFLRAKAAKIYYSQYVIKSFSNVVGRMPFLFVQYESGEKAAQSRGAIFKLLLGSEDVLFLPKYHVNRIATNVDDRRSSAVMKDPTSANAMMCRRFILILQFGRL